VGALADLRRAASVERISLHGLEPADVAALTRERLGSDAVAAAALDGRKTPDPVVLELGAGSGAFTAELAARLDGRGRQLAVELNPVLAHRLAERVPSVDVVPADVAELPTLLALRGLSRVDVVVSGLGWSATRPGRDDSLVPVLARHLADDGVLVQFAYTMTSRTATARALVRDLRGCFGEVGRSRVVWRNLPPAVVHRARHPRRT
jgi:phospholipid N-methyltransferase